MRKIIYKSTAIKAVIVIIAVIMVLTVFPLGLWKESKSFGMKAISDQKSEVINYRNSLSEIFLANGSHLQNIKLYIAEGTYDDDLYVSLFDSDGMPLTTVNVKTPENRKGYVDVLMDVDTVPNEAYTIKLKSMQSVYVGYEDWTTESAIVAFPLYNDVLVEGKCIVSDFEYKEPLSVAHACFIIGIIAFIAILLIALTDLVFSKLDKQKNKLITVERVVKSTLNPLVLLLVLVCLFFIFEGKVSRFVADNVFAGLAVVLLGAVSFYAINHKRDGEPPLLTSEYFRTHFGEIIQSLGIAYAIWGCCEYVAALYDIHHYVAMRKELIGIEIAIIAMFSLHEIFNIYNLCYVIVAGVVATIYSNRNITEAMSKDDMFLIYGNAIIAVLFGIIIIRTVLCLFKKEKSFKLNPIYSIISILYFALIVVFRNTRWWTVLLVISFTLIVINLGYWSKQKTFMTNVVRGVVIQFILMTIWTLLHRPYATFRTTRFPHFFHTETVTATYMTVVAVVSIVMFLTKVKACYEKSKNADSTIRIKLADIWKELLLFGTVLSYLIFTMARTAYFAIIVAFAFIFVMVFVGIKKDGFKLFINSILLLAAAVLVMLPIIFEAQRTIPCLVSDPYEYDIEEFEDEVMHGRNLDSDCYMLVGRLGIIFCEKILGISEDHFNPYYIEEVEYNEYHATRKQIYETGYSFSRFDIADDEWDKEPEGEQLEAFITQDADLYENENEEIASEEINEDSTTDSIAEEMPKENSSIDYTNGRLDIYKSYIEQLNMTGHNTMGAILKNGEEATHAHDVYLQVAFDHGIPTGIVFVIFGITSLIMSIIYFNKSNDKYKALPMTIIVAFAVAGIVEWVFHLGHPMSFVMLLTMVPLVYKER